MGLFWVSNWNYFKRVSLIGKFDSSKCTWSIKVFSINWGLEWLKWGLLRLSETSISFPGEHWLKWFVIIYYNKSATIQILMKVSYSKNYGFLFYLCIMAFCSLAEREMNRVPLFVIYSSLILFKKTQWSW